MDQEPHGALVLWVIREGIATTWSDLAGYFNIFDKTSGHLDLQEIIAKLWDAKLIQADNERDLHELLDSWGRRKSVDPAFSLTGQAHKVLGALDLHLTELAKSDPYKRRVVEPVLTRTFGDQYKSDILVFMPFTESLQPVYEDHIKAVATKLGQDVRRADDFFNTTEIIRDIWTALLETKMVIADCTDRNPNVFYEIGLADVVGRPTILLTQNRDNAPFDLRYRRHIGYNLTPRGMKDLETRLTKAIKRVIKSELTGDA